MEFSRLIDEFLNHQTAAEIDTPEGWTQGRTAYGGLTGALMLAAVQTAYDDLPPLRTIQINFVGPASGRLKVSCELLRRGQNTVTIEARLTGDDALAGRAIFTFGVNRAMQVQAHYQRRDDVSAPEDIPELAWTDRMPVFMKHFEARALKLSIPMSGSSEADNLIWFRHKDEHARDGIVPLIALGDAPPPAVLGMMKSVRGISSMNWNINMLVDAPQTRDGWWLLNTFSQHASNGYASQIMHVWDADGTRIMDAMQLIAAFE